MSGASEALGQRLKAERVRKGLSCQKAADELHLDGWVIEGLESGDYARIGPSVYAKGHLKRYGELLGLPVQELLEGFEDQPAPDAPAVQSSSLRMRTAPTPGSELPWLPIGLAALVALVVAGVLLWHPWRPRVPTTPTAGTQAAEPGAAAAPSPPPAPPADAGVPAGPVAASRGAAAAGAVAPAAPPVAAAPAPAPALATPAAPEALPAAASGRTRLRLLFLGDSWVDVRDAAGQRLFAGNGRANNVRSMSGMGPLRVYVKAASNVHLDLNNHAVVVGPQFILDNVAHFQAGADGVLRRDPQFPPPGAARPRG